MGGDCNCTWKCARSRFAVVYGVLSIVRVLIEFQNYLIGDTEDDDVQNHAAPIISIYTLIILLAHFLYSIALIYSVLKVSSSDFSCDVTQITNFFFRSTQSS